MTTVGVLAAGLAVLGGGASQGAPTPACAALKEPATGPNPTKILITGDSNTFATSGDYTWRYRLWNSLDADGVSFDFVGPFDYTADTINTLNQSHEYADCAFDWDHYAGGGLRLSHYIAVKNGETMSAIEKQVAIDMPDLVIAFVGVLDVGRWALEDANGNVDPSEDPDASENEIANAVLARLKQFIDDVRSSNPNADLVVTGVPATSADTTDRYHRYNNKVADAVANNPTWQTPTSEVVYNAMSDWQPPEHTWDVEASGIGYHADARGEILLGADFADSLAELGLGDGYPRPLNLASVPIGPRGQTVLTSASFDSGVDLEWTLPPGSNNTVVQRRDITIAGAWTDVATVKSFFATVPPPTDYTDTNVEAGHTYNYRVFAAKGVAVARDLPSNEESVTIPGTYNPPVTKPGPAFDARTIRKIRKINVDWSSVPSATSYDVRKRKGSGAWSTRNVAGDFASFGGLRACQAYSFQVRARNAGGASNWSSSLLAKPKGYVNAKLRKPSLKRRAGHKIRVGYQMRKSTATRYQIWIKQSGHGWKRYWDTKAPYVSKRLQKKKLYQVRVRAYDGCVAGKLSPIAKIRVG